MDRWCTLGTKGSSVGLGTGGERVDGSWRLSLKRRKTTGRYRVRTKEVMDDSATENIDVSSTEVDQIFDGYPRCRTSPQRKVLQRTNVSSKTRNKQLLLEIKKLSRQLNRPQRRARHLRSFFEKHGHGGCRPSERYRSAVSIRTGSIHDG